MSVAIFLHMLAVLCLGLYTAVGFHYYTFLVSRMRNDFVRIFFALLATALLIFGPLVAFIWVAPPPKIVPPSWRQSVSYLMFLLWLSPVYVYWIWNRRAVNDRMARWKGTNVR